uniref:Tetraspanin n=1 Tax=Kryptolebias marmoratus TaxID=37003 RepID=A0A3Q3AC35_KRYMA
MAQGCLKCLKYTMCVANFLCFICGVAVLSLGVYLMVTYQMTALIPSLANLNISKMLLISGIIITCISFLGFLGALKENRCLLLTFFLLLFILMLVELTAACLMLMYEQESRDVMPAHILCGIKCFYCFLMGFPQFECCGVHNFTDWESHVPASCCESKCDIPKPLYHKQGCLVKLNTWFEENFLTTGISVIVLCIIEVLGMCFAMTLFCHISRSGLGYKL